MTSLSLKSHGKEQPAFTIVIMNKILSCIMITKQNLDKKAHLVNIRLLTAFLSLELV